MTGTAPRPGPRRTGQQPPRDEAADRPGDSPCLLRRVCQACGAVAAADPPTTCPECGREIPGS